MTRRSRLRDGAWVADITGMLELSSWPAGIRVIVRKERPHPGAQLRFTDIDGHRFTAFATDARKGQLADLELRHRSRACRSVVRNHCIAADLNAGSLLFVLSSPFSYAAELGTLASGLLPATTSSTPRAVQLSGKRVRLPVTTPLAHLWC